MNNKNLLYLFVLTLHLCSCGSNENAKKYKPVEIGDSYEDGDYCAEVIYFNDNTKSKRKWTLPIVIEDGKLTEIHFKNGGWLDETHFIPPKLNNDDLFEFIDDRGYHYIVGILQDNMCEN